VQQRELRMPAILTTVVALALCNIGLAGLIANAVGARPFIGVGAAALVLLLGAAAAVGAVLLWRTFLRRGV
jgi:hypothetical protein